MYAIKYKAIVRYVRVDCYVCYVNEEEIQLFNNHVFIANKRLANGIILTNFSVCMI